MSADKKKVRVNAQIIANEVRLIDQEGNQAGIVTKQEALQIAKAANLDLVELGKESKPPVCRIMDYGKYLFQKKKRTKKKVQVSQLKELKIRPTTGENELLGFKLDKLREFLTKGCKVKISMRFRGREIAHQQLGADLMSLLENKVADIGTVEQPLTREGRQLIMVFAPKKH